MEAIEQRIEQICNDRVHGSRWLVKEALLLLREAAAQNLDMSHLYRYAGRFAQARPAMAALGSAVSQAVYIDDIVEGKEPTESAAAVFQKTQQLLDTYEKATDTIITHAQELIEGRVMTCSLSGTVVAVLAALRQQIEEVLVLEGRPGYEGREMARQLSKHGLRVTLLTDAQADIFLPRCHHLLVGADSILINGDVLNKAGTALLAWAAHGRNIPFSVVCETLKITPQRWIDHDPDHWEQNLRLLEEKEPDEVWEQPDPGIAVRNFYFDRTPYRLIRHIITEQGILDRRAIREIAIATRMYKKQLEKNNQR